MIILLVDDEEKNLELLEAVLYQENYQTLKASSGEEALKILGESRVDMVLLDVMLPGISGLEVLKTIRSNAALQTLPILLITSLADREHKILGLKAGADDYVSKPFDKSELLARVRTLARLSFLRRQITEKEKFEKVVEATDEGIIVMDNNFAPLIINQAARELLDIGSEPPENILTHINGKFQNGITAEKLGKDLKGHILERPETDEYSALYLSVSMHEVKNSSAEIIEYILIFKNVTAGYAEGKIKNTFLSLISHKFRTPLTIMSGSIELLSTLIKDETLQGFIKKIDKNEKELENILNRLLGFVEMSKKDLDETISVDIVDSYVAKCAKKYTFEYSLSKTITVESIPFWQGMILEELIDNSFKFFNGGKLQIDLVIRDNSIELSDNGPGIPPEEKEKIFEGFYQVEKYYTGQVPGLGLGLALVRKLAGLHNGKIVLQNNAEKGTNIKITFIPQEK